MLSSYPKNSTPNDATQSRNNNNTNFTKTRQKRNHTECKIHCQIQTLKQGNQGNLSEKALTCVVVHISMSINNNTENTQAVLTKEVRDKRALCAAKLESRSCPVS